MISGVVVASRPEDLGEVSDAVESFEWAEVHYGDASGRLVVTVEAADVAQSMERLQLIQDHERVLAISLAEYHFDDDGAGEGNPQAKGAPGSGPSVPAALLS